MLFRYSNFHMEEDVAERWTLNKVNGVKPETVQHATVEHVPVPSGAAAVNPLELLGISCTSDTDCMGVGIYRDKGDKGGTWRALAERWNGQQWRIEHVPTPQQGTSSQLSSVSCASSSHCMAVGYYERGGKEVTFAARFG